ncbi:MAG: ATP-binding protein [bacterium]
MSRTSLVNMIVPRGLQYLGRDLGMNRRVAIQWSQWSKYPKFIAGLSSSRSADSTAKITELEQRILGLQEDPYKFSPEVNFALRQISQSISISSVIISSLVAVGIRGLDLFMEGRDLWTGDDTSQAGVLALLGVTVGSYVRSWMMRDKIFNIELKGAHDELAEAKSKLEEAHRNVKQAHDEMKAEQLMLRDLFDNAPVGIYNVDADGVITQTNQTMAKMFRRTREQLIGTNIIDDWVVEEQRANARRRFELRKQGVPDKDLPAIPGGVRRYQVDDEIICAQTENRPYGDGFQTSFQDVSARVATEKELELAYQAMVEQEKEVALGHLARGFSHAARHQLFSMWATLNLQREPLAWMQGALNYLLFSLTHDREISEAELRLCLEQFSQIMTESLDFERHVAAMDRNVTNMLSFANVKSRPKESVPLREAMIEIYADLQKSARLSGVRISVDLRAIDDQARVYINRENLVDIFSNLFWNSVKAWRAAQTQDRPLNIVVTAERQLQPDSFCFSHHDNGPGIERERLEQLLVQQVESTHSGAGLGLTMVRDILTDVRGTIAMQSQVGEGTTAKVTLPVQSSTSAVAQPKRTKFPLLNEKQANQLKILLVDDDADLLILAGRLLEQSGFQVVTRQEPITSAEEANRLLAEEAPDILVIDITMPGGMDGHHVVNHLVGFSGLSILHSGEARTYLGEAVKETLKKDKVDFAQKGGGKELLEKIAEMVLSDERVGAKVAVFMDERDPLLDTPYGIFSRRLYHGINGQTSSVEALKTMWDNGWIDAAFVRDLSTALRSLNEWLAQIETFIASPSRPSNIALEQANLPADMLDDSLRRVWAEITPEQQQLRLKMLAHQFLASGVKQYCELINGLLGSVAEMDDINDGLVDAVGESVEELKRIYRSLVLLPDGDALLTQEYRGLYRLLNELEAMPQAE